MSALVSASSGPPPRIASRASGRLLVHARECPQQGGVVLLGDQAPDGDGERRVGRHARLGRGGVGRRRRQLVEAVADRHELRRVVTGALEEGADRVRDRDQAPGRPREGAVDVAERPEQVAVVVVTGRDGRDPEQTRGRAAVDVGVDEMRVDEVGPLRADGADGRRAPSAGSRRRRSGRERCGTPQPVELARRSAAKSVPGTSSPRKRASTPRSRNAGSSASRCPSEPLTPGELVQVEDLHRSRRS